MLKDQGNKTIKRECKQIYVKTPEKIGGKTTVEQGLNILTPEKIYLMCTTKNTRYCFFSLKHYCYYFLALFPFSLSTQYYQISTSLLLWYKATGFIFLKKRQLDSFFKKKATGLKTKKEKGNKITCRCKEQRCKKVSILHFHTLIYLFLRLSAIRCINHFKRH